MENQGLRPYVWTDKGYLRLSGRNGAAPTVKPALRRCDREILGRGGRGRGGGDVGGCVLGVGVWGMGGRGVTALEILLPYFLQ